MVSNKVKLLLNYIPTDIPDTILKESKTVTEHYMSSRGNSYEIIDGKVYQNIYGGSVSASNADYTMVTLDRVPSDIPSSVIKESNIATEHYVSSKGNSYVIKNGQVSQRIYGKQVTDSSSTAATPSAAPSSSSTKTTSSTTSSGKKSAGRNTTEAKKYLTKLNSTLSSMKTELPKLRSYIEAIEKGDGKVAYWSGPAATKNVKTLKQHYNNHVRVYNAFVDAYNALNVVLKKGSNLLG